MMSKRERMIGFLAAGVLGALALDQLLVTPLLARLDDANRRHDVAEQQLAQNQQWLDRDLNLRREWNRMAGESLKIDAPAAEGQLLNRVRDWAQDAGLSLTSLKPERPVREQGYQKLTIRATATGTMRQSSRFLLAIQNADIPVRVNDVQLTARREGTDDLALSVAVATIYLPPEAPGAAGSAAGGAAGSAGATGGTR
jgi:Tfp pilus assembly protein PilO